MEVQDGRGVGGHGIHLFPWIHQEYTFRKLLELISEFSNAAGYKINTQEPLGFLYTNNEKSERGIKNQSHSPLQQKELNI